MSEMPLMSQILYTAYGYSRAEDIHFIFQRGLHGTDE